MPNDMQKIMINMMMTQMAVDIHQQTKKEIQKMDMLSGEEKWVMLLAILSAALHSASIEVAHMVNEKDYVKVGGEFAIEALTEVIEKCRVIVE